MTAPNDDLKQSLAHVLWIGGSPDAGKTTIAQMIAFKYGLTYYQFDRHEMAHFARLVPERHPALYAAHPDRMNPQQRWVDPTPEEMARHTIASWTERAGMAVEDLLAMPTTSPILAEGPGFFPEWVAPLITDACQAAWLLPSVDFKRRSAARRNKPGDRHLTNDPERAIQNLIDRDNLMTAHIRERAEALGLTVFEVDGPHDMLRVAGLVDGWLAPHLPAPAPAAGTISVT